jgi:hypothetical protein
LFDGGVVIAKQGLFKGVQAGDYLLLVPGKQLII